jgi:hypothetical protein
MTIGDIKSPVILGDNQIAIALILYLVVNFLLRQLLRFSFTARAHIHHPIILQIDGFLFAVFRLRLVRDVCAYTHDSFCAQENHQSNFLRAVHATTHPPLCTACSQT